MAYNLDLKNLSPGLSILHGATCGECDKICQGKRQEENAVRRRDDEGENVKSIRFLKQQLPRLHSLLNRSPEDYSVAVLLVLCVDVCGCE